MNRAEHLPPAPVVPSMATTPQDDGSRPVPTETEGEATDGTEAGGTTQALDAAAEQLSGLRRALTIQEGDSALVGAAKILGMIVVAALLLALSPLIILGLVVGLAAAA